MTKQLLFAGGHLRLCKIISFLGLSLLAGIPGTASLSINVSPAVFTTKVMGRRSALLLPVATTALMPAVSLANEDTQKVMTLAELLGSLKSIPTFCIVNKDTGAAYMLYRKGEDMAKGYAFTTFQGALAVLSDAQRAAEKGGYADVWEGATITSIPADIAIRLALQPTKRTSQKDDLPQQINTILDLIPGIDERDVAAKIDRKFNEQGKVPLFYLEAMQRADDGAMPLYLNKDDLLADWAKQNGGDDALPGKNSIKVLDLTLIFQYAVRGRLNELPITNMVFMPHQDTIEVARDLKSRGLAPYKIDKMVV